MDNFLAILNEVWVNGLLGVSMTKIIFSIAVLLLSFLLRGFVVTVVVSSIEKLAKKFSLNRKSEIADKIKFLTGQDSLDEKRLMQEVAYLIERSDITEETVRVNIHIGSFLKYLELNDPVGKRLGFLAQEINREINTIGSKSPLPKITSKIVEIKNEIEKIKEQLQNIL